MEGTFLLYHHLFLLCTPLQFNLILLQIIVLLLMSKEKISQKTLSSIFHTQCHKNSEPKMAE